MTEVRRADPAVRRRALLFVALGALAGAALSIGLERYKEPLHDWLLSEPEKSVQRARLLFAILGALLSIPMAAFAAYLWSFGAKVLRARQFPPPGHRVIRDTPLCYGEAAMARGRGMRALALGLGVVAALLCVLIWRLVLAVGESAVRAS